MSARRKSYAIISPLVRQLPWTHNLIIFSQSKRPEEREFTLRRSLCPALIASYQTLLPDKKIFQAKLHEFYQMAIENRNP